jgi:hypothetical protein
VKYVVYWEDWRGRLNVSGRFNLRSTAEQVYAVMSLHVHRVAKLWVEAVFEESK